VGERQCLCNIPASVHDGGRLPCTRNHVRQITKTSTLYSNMKPWFVADGLITIVLQISPSWDRRHIHNTWLRITTCRRPSSPLLQPSPTFLSCE
jgi:hypothetical protein